MEKQKTNENQTHLGRIEISQESLEIIAGIAANEIEGVESMHGGFSSDVSDFFGRKNYKKGISLSTTEYGQLAIDVYCYLQFGINVPQVVADIQENIKTQVLFMTDIELAEINVHIVDLIPASELAATDHEFTKASV